jgi:hypothetical protein
MASAAYIDALVLNETKAIRWYVVWFMSTVSIGLMLIIMSLTMSWMVGIGTTIGGTFVLLLAKPPLTEVLRRRDRISALNTMKISLSQTTLENGEASRVDNIFWSMLQKMAEG